MKKNKKEVSAVVEEQEPKFVVKRNKVTWDYKRGVIEMSVDDLDNIFYQYSKHGLNMSQVQVQNDHGLDALQWQSFKRTFDLVKDSDVFSPYSLSLVSGKERCDMIASKIAEKYDEKNMRAVVAYESDKQRGKAMDAAIKKSAQADLKWQRLENAVMEYVSKAKAGKVRKVAGVKGGHYLASVFDLHGGAKIPKSRNQQGYDWNVIVKQLKKVAADINSRSSEKVTLALGGDFVETFTGLNHINSWQGIAEKDGYGVNAALKVTDILIDFISQINNIHEVLIVSGNHDRVTSSNKEDVTGEVAQIIHKILHCKFGEHFNVEWSADVITRKIDGCGFIISHGHLPMCKKPADMISLYGYKGCYNIILMGHFHARKVLLDHIMWRAIHCAAIFTGNTYSKTMAFSSLAGYTLIRVVNKHPEVIDVPLP